MNLKNIDQVEFLSSLYDCLTF